MTTIASSTWRRTSARPTNCSTGWAWRGETPKTSGCTRTVRARSRCRSPSARTRTRPSAQSAEILKAGWQSVGIKTNIAAVKQETRDSLHTTGIARDYSAYQYNPWMVQWTSLAPLTRGDLAGEIGKWYASYGDEGMAPSGGDPDWLPLASANEFPADAGGKLMRQSQMWIDGRGVSNLDPRRVEMGKEMFATNADQLWALNCCAYSGVFRGVLITRNNFRNKPITHERDHNGFTAWARFFEDGMDNFHHPGNRSKSTAEAGPSSRAAVRTTSAPRPCGRTQADKLGNYV